MPCKSVRLEFLGYSYIWSYILFFKAMERNTVQDSQDSQDFCYT